MYSAKKGGLRVWCSLMAVVLVCVFVQQFAPVYAEDNTLGGELGSNRYTQVLEENEPVEGLDLEGFVLLMENDSLAVYYRSEVGAIRVQDNRSGYVWGMMRED